MTATWTQAAKLLGVSPQKLRENRKLPGFPQFAPPFTGAQIEAMRQWREGNLRSSIPAEGTDLANIGARLKHSQMQLTELKREILSGKYIAAELHEAAMLAVTDLFVSKLDALKISAPARIVGMEPGEAERVLTELIDDLRRELSEKRTIEIDKARTLSTTRQSSRRGRPSARSNERTAS